MMDNNEEHFLSLSGIQHFLFCRRQWALIHVEQQWQENVKTVEGKNVHEKVDQPFLREKRNDKLSVRALPVKSNDLKVTGVCDLVEFVEDEEGVPLQGSINTYSPIPVEYKRGRPKNDNSDILQLVTQAICIEEMMLTDVPVGYLYYDEIKKRIEITITEERKTIVKKMFDEMHQYFNKGYTPIVKTGPICESCSLKNICLPELLNKESASDYVERKMHE